MPQAWLAGALVIWALAIAGVDLRQRRVPNSFLLLVAVPALLAQIIQQHGLLGVGLTDGLFGMAVGFALPFTGYLARQLGAGDVKYSALIGLLCGLGPLLQIILLASLVLGGMALAVWAWARWRNTTAQRLPAAVAISSAFIAQLIFSGSFGDL